MVDVGWELNCTGAQEEAQQQQQQQAIDNTKE